MGEKIRVGLAGFGYWAPNLARNLFQSKDFELVAIHDVSQECQTNIERLYPHVRFLTSWEDFCRKDLLDAMVIATPPATHAPLTNTALAAGIDVLVEKPLAMSVTEGESMVEQAKSCQRILMVGHTYEYNPAVERMHEMLDNNQLGHPFYAYSQRLNLGKIREDIDAWWNLAPHDVSIFNYLFQTMPIRVWGVGCHHVHKNLADVVFSTLEYPGQVLAHIHVSWLDPSKERKLTLVGSEKMAIFNDMDSEARLKIFDKKVIPGDQPDQYGLYHTKLHAGDVLIPRLPMVEPLAVELSHFAEAIRTRVAPRSCGLAGLRVLQVLEAVTISMQNAGEPVVLKHF